VAIHEALLKEFKSDLKAWGAEVDKDKLSFVFKSPDVLFGVNQTKMKPKFKEILNDFFPRYLAVLLLFESSIDEVRIEGHTSSVWSNTTGEDESYFNNMRLSQGRTRSVLQYVYTLDSMSSRREWVKKHIAAVGFSSSKLIVNEQGVEDRESSRRVTFRVITNAETKIRQIIEGGSS